MGIVMLLGCETVLTQVVNVVDLLQEVVFDDLPSICESSSAVNLSDYIQNHSGGISLDQGFRVMSLIRKLPVRGCI